MNSILKSFRNAVFLKEVQTKSKRIGLSLWIFILNIVLGISAFIAMMTVNTNIVSNNTVDSTVFVVFFEVVVIIEAVMLFFVTPAVTAGAIASEKERQTLDVLLTTSMTPWQIIWGKYLSSMANVLVLIISTLPFLSVVFLFGGVSFFTVLGTLLALIGSVLYIGTFGIFMSTAIKKTNAASVICYIWLMAVTFGTISATASIYAIADAINSEIGFYYPSLRGTDILKADWSIVLLLFSPVTVAYDILSRQFGMDLFWSNTDSGMGLFIEQITNHRLADTCFIARYWVIEALAVQLLTGYGVLKLAAKSLNPVKLRKRKVMKDKKRVERAMRAQANKEKSAE